MTLRSDVIVADTLQRTGGMWRADEARAALQISQTTLDDWRATRRILALPLTDGSYGYPVAQCAPPTSDGDAWCPLPGLAAVVDAAGDALTPHELFVLLATPQPALGGVRVPGGEPRTGFEAIAGGDGELVADLVAFLVTPDDAGAPRPQNG